MKTNRLLICKFFKCRCSIYWNNLYKSLTVFYNFVVYILKGCKPMSVWAFIRHGQRSPGAVFAKNMLDTIRVRDYVAESYRRGNSSLCTEDVENLLNWEPSEEFKARHSLTRNGYQEVFGIGRRLKEAFSELLSDLEDGSYSIRSAYGYWVEDGVEGFVKGLSNKSLLVEDAIPHYDIMSVSKETEC